MIFIEISFFFLQAGNKHTSVESLHSCTLEQLSWVSETSTSDKCIICALCNHLTVFVQN